MKAAVKSLDIYVLFNKTNIFMISDVTMADALISNSKDETEDGRALNG